MIRIKKVSESQIHISGDSGYLQELKEYLSFEIPNAHFNPKVRARRWDGIIRLIHAGTGLTYAGLSSHIETFCKERNYICENDDEEPLEEISINEAKEFAAKFVLKNGAGEKIVPDDFQIRAFAKAIRYRRRTLIFPTGGGKSLIAFLIVNWLLEHDMASKICMVVPSTTLVDQMFGDFKDYSWDSDKLIHKIYSGAEKHSDKVLTITTWQSALRMPEEWFKQFDGVIGDEAQEFAAKSLVKILLAMKRAKFRIGMSGSLDNKKVNRLVIEGLFGPLAIVATAKELQDKGRMAEIRIKGILLKHPKEVVKALPDKLDYPKEVDFLVSNPSRNRFITNLALSLKGNTLVMYNLIEKHGKLLHQMLEAKKTPERKLYYIHGGIDTDIRNEYRIEGNEEDDAIFLASYGTFRRGINIPNIHNIILALGFKSTTLNKQTLGRGLRITKTKTLLTVYDIADDLRDFNTKTQEYGKYNYALEHFMERLDIYKSQEFEYKIYNVKMKEGN